MYEITIIKRVEAKENVNTWEQLRQPYADEKEQGLTAAEKAHDPQYGYRSIERVVSKNVDIYSQLVEELDLNAVIKAINGIKN